MIPTSDTMNLIFVFCSDPVGHEGRFNQLLAECDAMLPDLEWGASPPRPRGRGDGAVEMELELQWQSPHEDGMAIGCALQLVQVARQLTERFGLAWQVSHQYDPAVGRIDLESDLQTLEGEIQTAIQIASSLEELGGAEPLEAWMPGDGEQLPFPPEESQWDGWVGANDVFLRFPELE